MSFGNISPGAGLTGENVSEYLNEKTAALLSPQGAEGIGGFVFDIEDSETLSLSADITDHFTEDNSFISDHKTIKPKTVTLSGFIGELVYRGPTGVERAASIINNRLETVEAYAGDLTPGGVQAVQSAISQAQSVASAINQTVERTKNVVSEFQGEGIQSTAQQRAYGTLNALFNSRKLLSIQTPWVFLDNMMIQSVVCSQDGQTGSISDISVTLKEIRFSKVTVTDFDTDQFPIREQVQAGAEQDQGIVQGEPRNESFLFSSLIGE